jgi:hypothetical protein
MTNFIDDVKELINLAQKLEAPESYFERLPILLYRPSKLFTVKPARHAAHSLCVARH